MLNGRSTRPANGWARSHGRAASGKKARGTTRPENRFESGAARVLTPRSVMVTAITTLISTVMAADSSIIPTAEAAKRPAAFQLVGAGRLHRLKPISGS